MIELDLLYNLFVLLALSVTSNFIDQFSDRRTYKGQILQGLLFGIIGIIGMMHPFEFAKGIIFDGRSIIISLATLIFGPVSGLISSFLTIVYRIYLGGGVVMDVLVISFSFVWGYLFYERINKEKLKLTNLKIYILGFIVSANMILFMTFLPSFQIILAIEQIAPTVIIFYPLITMALGRILLNQLNINDTLTALRQSEELIKTTFYSIGDAVITTDKFGKVLRMNSQAEELTGWKENEAKGKSLEEVFVIFNEYTKNPAPNPIKLVLEKGLTTNLANHTMLLSKNGKEFPIVDSAAPIKINEETIGVVLVFRDQTIERERLKKLEEKERFQNFIISHLPGFVYRCAYDKNWTMFYLSDGCIEITGYSPQEFIDNNPVFNDIIFPEFHNKIYHLWDTALKNRSYFEFTYPIKTKSGDKKWIWEKGRGVFSDSGDLLFLEGYITDVTEKLNYQLQLEESENKFRIISNLISDYLFSTTIDKDGRGITDWVAGAFEEITGYTFEEYNKLGGWSSFLHPDDVENDKIAYQNILNNQQVVIEVRTYHKSGRIIWVRVFAHPIWNEEEKRVTGIIGAVQDITSLKRSELLNQIEVKVSDAVLKHKTEFELFDLIRQELSKIVDIRNFFIAFYNKETGLLSSLVESDEKDSIPIWKAKGSLTGYLIEQNKTLCLSKSDIHNLKIQNKVEIIGTIPEQWLGVPLNVMGEVVGAIVVQDYSNAKAFDEHIIRIMEAISNYLTIFIERNRKDEQISENAERFKNLFENSDAILLLIDAESGMITDANKSAQKFYGYSVDELKEKTIFDIDVASTEVIKKSMIKIYQRTQSKFESRHKLADGQIKNVEVYTSLITIKNHKFFYAIIFDKTEQKKAEKEIQLLKTAIVQNPTIICITNVNGEIEFVNPKFTETTQFTLEDVKGKNLKILKSGFHSKEFYAEMWNTIIKGKEWHGEVLNRKKDGTLYWVLSIISPIMDRFGKITHFVAMQEDITQRKKIMENLVKSEEEFRSVWENSFDAMRLVNEEGIIVNVNNAFCNLFKVKKNDVIGKPYNCTFNDKNPKKSIETFIQRFKLRTIKSKFETDIPLLDNTVIWVELTNAFIETKNSPTLLLSIFRDITSYKKLLSETILAKEKAEEMNKVKSYFFANMSHELRTPLVGILGFADILREELEDNPELSKMAELITKSGQRLHETLNLILSLSKLESGKLEVKISEENIIPYIVNSFNLFEQSARKKGLSYNLELPQARVICRIDPNLIQNTLNNLINNAIKFTIEGSITVKLELLNKAARIHVKDTGIGIPKEHHSIIWEEFRQVSEGLNRSFEGTGLGLTIVKRFTSLIGGKIYLESEKGKGSDFILEFPLVDKSFENEIKLASNNNKHKKDISNSEFDLLYVEDDQNSLDLVNRLLKDRYNLDIARNADEALMKVKQNSYKAILMDINLKGNTDGVQLTKLIRQINNYENIPIAAITAYAQGKDKNIFLSQGMTHYLSKPFSKNELFDLIEKMLET